MPNPAEGTAHENHDAPDLRRRPSIHGTLLRYTSHSHLQILTREPVQIRLCARPLITAFPGETQRHIRSTRTTQTIAYQRRNWCFRLVSIGNECNEVSVETHERPRSYAHANERDLEGKTMFPEEVRTVALSALSPCTHSSAGSQLHGNTMQSLL